MTAPGGRVRLVGRRRRAGSGVPIWFGAAFAAVGIVTMVAALAGHRNTARLADEGVATQGTVVRLYTSPTEGNRYEYWVAYAFTDPASGRMYRDSAQVSRTTFTSTTVGDPIQVTYLPSDPGNHTVGTPDANPLVLLMVEGMGLLFAVVGAGLVWSTIRRRRPRPATPAVGAPATVTQAGDSSVASDVARSRVDVFSRSRMRVVMTALTPLIGLGAIALAALVWTDAADPERLFFGGIAALLGTLFFLIGIGSVRQGLGRRMLEVGPDGIWLRGLGRLGWSDVGEVRLEEAHPAATASASPTGGKGGGTPLELEMVTQAVAPTYTRVAIVPRDPALAPRSPMAWTLAAGIGAVVSLRPGARAPDQGPIARYGLRAFEISQPLEEVVASLRRFVPKESVAAAEPAQSLGSPDPRLAPSFVEVAPGTTAVPANASYRQRRGSLLGGAQVQVDGGGIGSTLLTAAIGTIAGAVRSSEPTPEVLRVTAAGLSIPDVADLAWDAIGTIDVEERSFNERPDNILRVVPADPAETEAHRPPHGSAWKVGRLGGSLLRGGGSPAYVIHLTAIEADADAVLDVIAQYHVVDEGP